ncbi:hypothetical protein AAEX28_14530 [Lentisphaerota bacterium WC36G]|nr:hypothetical protein LJT99_01285 [Lentisphaerae bacterium WC36]
MTTKSETNFNRLKKTVLAANFVKKHNGSWDHNQWLEFCETLKSKKYTPIDFDQVGLLLEEKKANYFANQ